jgi:hypothetical protein
VWLTEEGDDVGDNLGQSAGTRQQEGAQQAAVSPSTALPPREEKGFTAPPPHPPPFMIIVSPGRLGLTQATGSTAQWLMARWARRLNGLMGSTA